VSIKDCYVGSTTNLIKRRCGHKGNCINENNRDYNIPVYQFIREYGGWDNWAVVVIENYPCANKQELETRERYWIEQLGATLNKLIPARSKTEWRNRNHDYNKNYYIANKEAILNRTKNYCINNKEMISEARKKFRLENKENISEARKKYYLENKEKILEASKIKITCECGCVITKTHIRRHKNTLKHNNILKTLNEPPPAYEENISDTN
jgi:hypothetical protein